MVSVELTTGPVKSEIASATGAADAFLHAAMDAFHHHDRVVDDEADRHGEPSHRHQVDRLAEDPHHDKRHENGKRKRDRRDEGEPPVAQEQQEDRHAEDAAEQDGIADIRNRRAHELRQIVDLRDVQARRERARQFVNGLLHARLDVEDVRADLLRHADARGIAPVSGDQARAIGRAGKHLGDVLHP